MNIAFYAPLKSPTHRVPSGDRLIARQFLAALRAIGHQVELASSFRSWDGTGDSRRQERLMHIGEKLVDRRLATYLSRPSTRRPQCWFTYHLYHKAPDWLGPSISRRLSIPYVVAEASNAHKQRAGPWSLGYRAALDALSHADLLLALNTMDVPGVQSVADRHARVVHLPPFLDTQAFVNHGGRSRAELSSCFELPMQSPWLIVVAMMRPGNKLASFQVLAASLEILVKLDWHLLVIGDGQAKPAVKQAFADLPCSRISFLGQQPRETVVELLSAADVFVWPAVDEPLGMVFLEAQAAGLSVVAGDSRGVGDLVQEGRTGRLVPAGDVEAFAAAVAHLLRCSAERERLGRRGQAVVRQRHDTSQAQAVLAHEIGRLMKNPD